MPIDVFTEPDPSGSITLSIVESPVSDSEWDRAWAETPSATAYASRAWAEVWAAAFPGRFRPTPTRLTWLDGASAIVPVTIERRIGGVVRIARLGPAGTYSTILGSSTSAASAIPIGRAIDWLLHRHRDIVLTLSPFAPPVELPVTGRLSGMTLAVGVGASIEELRSRWSSGRKNDLARARRAGLCVAPARSPADWAAYYECYLDSVRRWGAQTRIEYPRVLFDALASAPDRLIRLWIARKADEVVGGAVVLYDGSCAYYWHAASRREGLQVGSATALLQEVLRDATDRGLRYVDLGASRDLPGVAEFKAGFRPNELPTSTLIRQSPISHLARRFARRR